MFIQLPILNPRTGEVYGAYSRFQRMRIGPPRVGDLMVVNTHVDGSRGLRVESVVWGALNLSGVSVKLQRVRHSLALHRSLTDERHKWKWSLSGAPSVAGRPFPDAPDLRDLDDDRFGTHLFPDE